MQGRERLSAKPGRAHRPAVDTFGTLRAPDGSESRARLVEYREGRLAAFSADDPTSPLLFDVTSMNIKGRLLTAGTADGELKFQKAGCGCETPYALKIGRNALLRGAALLDEGETAEPAETQTLMQDLLNGDVPGAQP